METLNNDEDYTIFNYALLNDILDGSDMLYDGKSN